MATLRAVLAEIDAGLQRLPPRRRPKLRAAATSPELEALRSELGKLPRDLRDWFAWHDGQQGQLPLALGENRTLMPIDVALRARAIAPQEVLGEWRSSWLPVMTAGRGNYLVYDLETGQLIGCWYDDDARDLEYRSLLDWANARLRGVRVLCLVESVRAVRAPKIGPEPEDVLGRSVEDSLVIDYLRTLPGLEPSGVDEGLLRSANCHVGLSFDESGRARVRELRLASPARLPRGESYRAAPTRLAKTFGDVYCDSDHEGRLVRWWDAPERLVRVEWHEGARRIEHVTLSVPTADELVDRAIQRIDANDATPQQLDVATRLLDAALERAADPALRARALHGKAVLLFNEGEYKRSIRLLDAAIPLSEFDRCRYLRGLAHYNLGDSRKALVDFSRAAELNPTEPEFFEKRGYVRFDLREYADAAEDFTRAIALGDTSSVTWANRAESYCHAGRFEEARRDIDHAFHVAGPEEDDFLFYVRGLARLGLGQQGAAVADLKKAAQLGNELAVARLKELSRR